MLVSPSGGGKSTMTKRLLQDFSNIHFSVSATTRPPREGEKEGIHYYFLSKEEFEDRVERGDFLEWEEFYNGTLYGTLRSDVENELEKGYFILLDIEVLGALNVKKIFGDEALAIFIQPPSLDVLKERLMKRGTEDEQTVQTRIDRAKKEMEYANCFDHVIINDDLETAYGQIHEIVTNYITQ